MIGSTGYIGPSNEERRASRARRAADAYQRDLYRAGKVKVDLNADGTPKAPRWADPMARMKLGAAQGIAAQDALAAPGGDPTADPVAEALKMHQQRREFEKGAQAIDAKMGLQTPSPMTADAPMAALPNRQAASSAASAAMPAAPVTPGVRTINGQTLKPDEVLGPDNKPMKRKAQGTITTNGVDVTAGQANDPWKRVLARGVQSAQSRMPAPLAIRG